MRIVHQWRRDGQQWMLDWLVKMTGRAINFEYDDRHYPEGVKNYVMVPKVCGQRGLHEEAVARGADRAGHRDTAFEAYCRAVNSYHLAQHAVFYDDHPVKLHWYRNVTTV